MFDKCVCDKCGQIDIVKSGWLHNMRKYEFTFIDCGGTFVKFESEPTQMNLSKTSVLKPLCFSRESLSIDIRAEGSASQAKEALRQMKT